MRDVWKKGALVCSLIIDVPPRCVDDAVPLAVRDAR
jgi:hypothetical protein